VVYSRSVNNGFPLRKALALRIIAGDWPPVYRESAPAIDLGAVNKKPVPLALETILNGPDSSTSGGRCNLSFTIFSEVAKSCTIDGETPRKGYQSHCGKQANFTVCHDAVDPALRRRTSLASECNMFFSRLTVCSWIADNVTARKQVGVRFSMYVFPLFLLRFVARSRMAKAFCNVASKLAHDPQALDAGFGAPPAIYSEMPIKRRFSRGNRSEFRCPSEPFNPTAATV
jgi:hypothetical protein